MGLSDGGVALGSSETSAGREKVQRQDVASLRDAQGILDMQDTAGTSPEHSLAPLPPPAPTPTPCRC